jgi:hypothetical protein
MLFSGLVQNSARRDNPAEFLGRLADKGRVGLIKKRITRGKHFGDIERGW